MYEDVPQYTGVCYLFTYHVLLILDPQAQETIRPRAVFLHGFPAMDPRIDSVVIGV